uniref:hypothetical protein n=1 Tax=Candidatus Ichthyocystis sparus TaxID=1561004 RepID=UPI00159EE110
DYSGEGNSSKGKVKCDVGGAYGASDYHCDDGGFGEYEARIRSSSLAAGCADRRPILFGSKSKGSFLDRGGCNPDYRQGDGDKDWSHQQRVRSQSVAVGLGKKEDLQGTVSKGVTGAVANSSKGLGGDWFSHRRGRSKSFGLGMMSEGLSKSTRWGWLGNPSVAYPESKYGRESPRRIDSASSFFMPPKATEVSSFGGNFVSCNDSVMVVDKEGKASFIDGNKPLMIVMGGRITSLGLGHPDNKEGDDVEKDKGDGSSCDDELLVLSPDNDAEDEVDSGADKGKNEGKKKKGFFKRFFSK